MLLSIIYFVVFSIAMLAFSVLIILISKILSHENPTSIKVSTYECGEEPIGEGRAQLIVQYWSYAIVFTIFDVFVTFLLLISKVLVSQMSISPMPLLIVIAVFALALFYSWEALVERGL
jgi:NADH-quinone oxidoreductase subunit A